MVLEHTSTKKHTFDYSRLEVIDYCIASEPDSPIDTTKINIQNTRQWLCDTCFKVTDIHTHTYTHPLDNSIGSSALKPFI